MTNVSIKATFTYYLKSRESLFQSKRENWKKKMLNNNQKLLHPIVKHIRFVAQQAIEGSHAAQLQKNTQNFFSGGLTAF